MSDLSREALVTEAEKVNADRMALIAWVKELEAVEKAGYRYKFTPEARIWHKERAERFATLLSLLASEGEKVKELEAKYTPLYQGMLTSAVALLDAGYKGDGIPDGIGWLKADRDRLAVEVERLKNSNCAVCHKAEAEVTQLQQVATEAQAAVFVLKEQLEVEQAKVTRLTARWGRALEALSVKRKELYDPEATCSPTVYVRGQVDGVLAALKLLGEIGAER